MVITSLDFDNPGKQQGFLQVPYSHNLGGWANVMIPITIVARGNGPTVLVLGGYDWHGPAAPRLAWADAISGPTVRTVAPLLLLLVLAQPPVMAEAPETLAAALQTMRTTGLNASDLTRQHKGYYEQLDVRAQLDAPVSADGRKRDASWQDLSQLGVLNNDRRDLLLRDLKPSKSVTLLNRHQMLLYLLLPHSMHYQQSQQRNILFSYLV